MVCKKKTIFKIGDKVVPRYGKSVYGSEIDKNIICEVIKLGRDDLSDPTHKDYIYVKIIKSNKPSYEGHISWNNGKDFELLANTLN